MVSLCGCWATKSPWLCLLCQQRDGRDRAHHAKEGCRVGAAGRGAGHRRTAEVNRLPLCRIPADPECTDGHTLFEANCVICVRIIYLTKVAVINNPVLMHNRYIVDLACSVAQFGMIGDMTGHDTLNEESGCCQHV